MVFDEVGRENLSVEKGEGTVCCGASNALVVTAQAC